MEIIYRLSLYPSLLFPLKISTKMFECGNLFECFTNSKERNKYENYSNFKFNSKYTNKKVQLSNHIIIAPEWVFCTLHMISKWIEINWICGLNVTTFSGWKGINVFFAICLESRLTSHGKCKQIAAHNSSYNRNLIQTKIESRIFELLANTNNSKMLNERIHNLRTPKEVILLLDTFLSS